MLVLVVNGLLAVTPVPAPTAGLDGIWPGGWMLPVAQPSRGPVWWAAVGGGRPFGLAVLALRRLAIGRAGRGHLVRLRWRQSGGDTLWRENAGDLLWLAGRRRLAGFRLAGECGTGLPTAWSLDLAGAVRGGSWWVLGCWALLGGGPPGDRLLAAAGMRRRTTALAAAVWSGGDRPVVAGACWWRPVSPLALGVRLDPETGELGFLVAVRRRGTTVRLAWLLHPALGTSRYADVMWGTPVDGP